MFSHVHISPFCPSFPQVFHWAFFPWRVCKSGLLQWAAPGLFLALWPEFTAPEQPQGTGDPSPTSRKSIPPSFLSGASSMWSLLQGERDQKPFATGIPLGNSSRPTEEAAQKELVCTYKAAVSPAIKPTTSLQGLAVVPCGYLPRIRVRRCCRRCAQYSTTPGVMLSPIPLFHFQNWLPRLGWLGSSQARYCG